MFFDPDPTVSFLPYAAVRIGTISGPSGSDTLDIPSIGLPRMRRPGLELPGIPLHITHRGVDRGATFIDDDDCAIYFDALRIAAIAQDVAVHGWVLMGNHVHCW